jgi:hypothetical protein
MPGVPFLDRIAIQSSFNKSIAKKTSYQSKALMAHSLLTTPPNTFQKEFPHDSSIYILYPALDLHFLHSL